MEAIAPISHEQWCSLIEYADHLQTWQKTVNLVAPSTLGSLWQRHILDSWQLVPLAGRQEQGALLDLGSGAGLPGMVLAIAGIRDVHLIESNKRKASFLRYVAQQTGTPCQVHAERIQALRPCEFGRISMIVARALAALHELLAMAFPCCSQETTLLFPKGRRWQEEVREAEKTFSFSVTTHQSVTDSDGVILELSHLARR